MERLSHLANVSGKEFVHGAASIPCLDEGGEANLRESYQPDGLQSTSYCSTNRSMPEVLSDQGHGSIRHVQHHEWLCWNEGCDRQAEAGPTSQEGEINLFCSDHQSSDVIATRTAHCQITGCYNTPKYGQQKGPLKFCQQHKRVGMYTNRNGQRLLATRDGSGFKDKDEAEVVNPALLMDKFALQREITDLGRTGGESIVPESTSLHPSKELSLRVFVRPTNLGPTCSRVKTPSRTVGATTATPQYRKMCEVTGCCIQPSYGPSGTSRPRFCSTHKKEGMVGLKNRPCTFPGCNTRPHYGLLGSRPIYCAKHKEPNMVHLLKEATIREKMDMTRDLKKIAGTTAEPIRSESKRFLSATRSKEGQLRQKLPKKNTATFQVQDVQEMNSRECADGASRIPLSRQRQQHKQGAKETGKGGIDCQHKTTSVIPTACSSSVSTSIPALKESTAFTKIPGVLPQVMASAEREDTGKCGYASETPYSRSGGTLDITPSLEMQVLKDIRGSAQTEETVNGSGRRARVPSRKALEASGKLKNDGIQWLTREKKEEEARRMRELRAQRKAAAAAGLKAGQVLEAATIGSTFNANRANCEGDISKPELTKTMWRKLSPAEIMEVAAIKPITSVIETTHTDGRSETASGAKQAHSDRWKNGVEETASGGSEGKRGETEWVHQGTTKAITSKSSTTFVEDKKCRKEPHGDQLTQIRQAMPSPGRKETNQASGWASTGRNAGNVQAREVDGMKICQFEDCSKMATFGVNSTVRYCKLHALFGMHRIDATL